VLPPEMGHNNFCV